ncbi:hypothetical protein D3C84_1048520 [compost metagenome]
MYVARIGRLDEQNRFDGQLLVRRLLEFRKALQQQSLVVQRYTEQGAGRDVMQGMAHASLLAVAGREVSGLIIVNMLSL